MGANEILMEAADGDVVYADGADAAFGQILGRFVRDVDEVVVEGVGLVAALRVDGLEQDAFAGLEIVWFEFGAANGGGVLNFDDAARADVASSGSCSMVMPSWMKCRGASMCVPVCALMAMRVTLQTLPFSMDASRSMATAGSPGQVTMPDLRGREISSNAMSIKRFLFRAL